jgi:hypothetical protein
VTRAIAPALVAFASSSPTAAHAHQPDNPDAHRSMPNQVTAGVIALCPSSYDVDEPMGDVSAEGVACIGAQLSFSRELGRFFELRLRTAYERPFLFADELGSLHDIRATIGGSAVFYRLSDDLTLTVGPELGLAAFVRETKDESPAYWGIAWGGVLGIRPWLTYHTGLFAEAAFGGATAWDDGDSTLRSTTLGRLTLGWADRF